MNKKVAAGIGLIAGALGLYLLTTRKAKPCTEGTTKCVGADLYACVNGKWVLQQLNSPACITPVSCSVDADCPAGYVCQNGVCVPQPVKLWEFYGVVTDAQTQAVIPSVTVSMNGISSTGDSEGKYTISGIVDTEHIVVTFSKEGYASREYGVGWSGKPYELNASLVLKEIAQATLYGTVTDIKGNLVEGATLSLYWDGETHPEYSATIASSYSVSAVSPGAWHITVEKQGYETWDGMVTIVGGEPNELNIVLAQIWNWEGIYQPSDYLSKWEDMVAAQGNMEGVIADISQISGIGFGPFVPTRDPDEKHEACIFNSECYSVPSIRGLDTKLASLSAETVAYIAHIPEANRCWVELEEMAEKYGYSSEAWRFTILLTMTGYRGGQPYEIWLFSGTVDTYHISDADVATIKQDRDYLMQWTCRVVGVIPYTEAGLCAERNAWTGMPYADPSLPAGQGIVGKYLNYIAVYAECKRHGSSAPSFYAFWEYLKVREYGPGCPGRHCQVAGYIFYDAYGSGIGWDVDYRWSRWPQPYQTGELLHYV